MIGRSNEDGSPVLVKHPAWRLRSVWQPFACEMTLELDSRGLGPAGDRIRLAFNDRFPDELDSFIERLQQWRENQEPSRCQTMTILGVRLGLTRQAVEQIHGEPELEAKCYRTIFDHRSGRHFDLERVNCSYGELQVTFYQDDADLKVLVVRGPQVEHGNIPFVFAGHKFDPDEETFNWRKPEFAEPWETYPDSDGWWRLEPIRGFFRLDEHGRFKQFRLGQDWGMLGKRVAPLT